MTSGRQAALRAMLALGLPFAAGCADPAPPDGHDAGPPEACRLDSECGVGRVCKEGACRDGCRDDRYCSDTERCIDGQCVGGPPGTIPPPPETPCDAPPSASYCMDDAVWQDDGCGSPRRLLQCEVGCEEGACVGVDCDSGHQFICQGDAIHRFDACGASEWVEDCAFGCETVEGQARCLVCDPTFGAPRCEAGVRFAEDGCGERLEIERCPHGCDGAVCRDCDQTFGDPYCRGPEIWVRNACGDDELRRPCPHGCSAGECLPCDRSFGDPFCRGDDRYARNACGDEVLVDECAHGCDPQQDVCRCNPTFGRAVCEGNRLVQRNDCGAVRSEDCPYGCNGDHCREPVCRQVTTCERARPASRPPLDHEHVDHPEGRVLSLTAAETDLCGQLGFALRKADGTALGAGRYHLRVGTCRDVGSVRDVVVLDAPTDEIDFVTDHRGADGEVKEFCATKESAVESPQGERRAWWYSNFARVLRRDREVCE